MKGDKHVLKRFSAISTLALAMIIWVSGCAGSGHKAVYETVRVAPNRDTAKARKENSLAVELLRNREYDEAEKILKDALASDVTFGAAHNNLGKIYYLQSKFYLAAWEFQYAIKLMPHHPEPRNNLGLVLEAVGRLDEAADIYNEALYLQPDNPQIIGNLARTRIRRGDKDDDLRQLLSDLIMRDTRPEWITWAREKLALLGQPIEDNTTDISEP